MPRGVTLEGPILVTPPSPQKLPAQQALDDDRWTLTADWLPARIFHDRQAVRYLLEAYVQKPGQHHLFQAPVTSSQMDLYL